MAAYMRRCAVRGKLSCDLLMLTALGCFGRESASSYCIIDASCARELIWCIPSPQIGFGAYPVVVKKLAQQSSANPIIFTFYR